jgi:glycosyltransferase involved in cell wall biosynthesis
VTPISAVLITRDEEAQVAAAVASVRFCDEVLVVDAGSADATARAAADAGARVVVRAPWPGYVPQRVFAAAEARNDALLFLDADERVSARLREELEALRRDGLACPGYRMPRVAFYMGRWIRATDWYPDPQLRLFDRRRGGWEGGRVHESVRVAGPVGRLRGEIEHYPYQGLAHHLRKIDTYTTLWAEQAREDGRRAGLLAPSFSAAWAFFRNYVLRRGFLLGEAGLTVSAMGAFYAYVKLAKLRERWRNQR